MNNKVTETELHEMLPKPRRDYKDTIFRMIFSEKKGIVGIV